MAGLYSFMPQLMTKKDLHHEGATPDKAPGDFGLERSSLAGSAPNRATRSKVAQDISLAALPHPGPLPLGEGAERLRQADGRARSQGMKKTYPCKG